MSYVTFRLSTGGTVPRSHESILRYALLYVVAAYNSAAAIRYSLFCGVHLLYVLLQLPQNVCILYNLLTT